MTSIKAHFIPRYAEMRNCCEFLLKFLAENNFELAKQKKSRKANNAIEKIKLRMIVIGINYGSPASPV